MTSPDLMRLSKALGRIFMRAMGLSWSVHYRSPPAAKAGSARGRPTLFAFWHGRQLPLIHTHRNEGISVLVSLHQDGEYVANVLHSMGFRTVRGSTSKGGADAVREMADLLRRGKDCAITPDGPRGPAERAAPGTALISRLGGRPVVPMGTSAWPSLRFSSWDRFILPLPFSRVAVVEGPPIDPPRRGEDPEIWTGRLEAGLEAAAACADMLASPSSRIMRSMVANAGRLLRPVAEAALLARPSRERRERRGFARSSPSSPVWLHGSSLGELRGLLPCAALLRRKRIPVYMTCFTPAGRKFIEQEGLEGGFIPLDIPVFVDRFIARVRPRALVISETEIWPNCILGALEAGVPCLLINGRLSERSLKGYRMLGSLPGMMLSGFIGILARTEEDRSRFLALGVRERALRVSADSKALSDAGDPPREWRTSLGTRAPVLVAGSTRKGEEKVVLEACRSAGYFPVLAPRHLGRVKEVTAVMRDAGMTPVLWSELEAGDPGHHFDSVLIDVHGILARMYGSGDAAFVGGTLVPIGGHNVLEPVMRGVPVAVGPYYGSYRTEVDELIEAGGAHVFSTAEELARILLSLTGSGTAAERTESRYRSAGMGMLEEFTSMLRSAGVSITDEKS